MNHTIILYFRAICLFSLLSFFSCTEDYSENYLANTPIYLSYEEMRSGVRFDSPREIIKPGQIYFKGDTFFIVEPYEGIHVLTLNNPEKPKKIGFLTIPGCTDLSIRENLLLVNSYIDLVGIDISDLSNIRETSRVQNTFTYLIPQRDNEHPIIGVDSSKGIVIDWEVKRVEQDFEVPGEELRYPVYDKNNSNQTYISSGTNTGGTAFKTGGTMANFGLYDRYLYVIENRFMIHVYDISNPSSIKRIENSHNFSSQAETMFIYDGHMFIGTPTGVDVFSLATPNTPQRITKYQHITACDPLVVQSGYAYYTLRSGTTCRETGINRLDILKLSDDYTSSKLIATYNLTEPYGLGVDGNTLFVCDGEAGLKVYDVTDKTNLTEKKIAEFPSIHAYDVIPLQKYLFTIGDGGFYLYDYSDIKNIKLVSSIPVSIMID